MVPSEGQPRAPSNADLKVCPGLRVGALSNASQRKAAKAAGPVGATCASRQPGVRDHPRYSGKVRPPRGPQKFSPLSHKLRPDFGHFPRRLRLDWVSWLYPVTVSTRKVSKGCRPAASGGDGVGLTEARTPARRLHRRKVVGSDPPRSTSRTLCRGISGRRGSRRPACSKRFEEGISCDFVRRCLLSRHVLQCIVLF